MLMEAIIDHKKDDTALIMQDKYIITKTGQRRLGQTTKGWKLLVKWKDGSESWVKLTDIKEAQPVDLAEYAKARGIDQEPAFAWWVPYTLRQCDVILSAFKKRIRKTTREYGIELPSNSVKDAHRLD